MQLSRQKTISKRITSRSPSPDELNMPAHTDTQSAHDRTPTPAAQPETIRNVSKKRQRMHLEDADTSDEQYDNSESDDEVFRKAEKFRALEKLRARKQLGKVKRDLRGIDERQSTFEKGSEEYKKVFEGELTTIKNSVSRFNESLKLLPTSTRVKELVDAECKAREDALIKCTKDITTTMTASFDARIGEFQKTSLKTTLEIGLAHLKDRIATAETSLNTVQVTLADMGSQMNQRPTSADFQKLIAAEHEEREKALTLSNGKMSMTFTTQLDARLAKCKSDLETVAVPKALEPLDQRIDEISGVYNTLEEKVLAVTDLQEKSTRDHEWQFKGLEKTIHDLKVSYTKDRERLEAVVDGLQQGLCAERKKNADMKTSIDQLEASRVEDKKEFETTIDGLRGELRAEREKRENTNAKYETILERLESIEQQAAATKKAQEDFDEKMKAVGDKAATKTQVNQDIMPKLLVHREGIRKLMAQLEEQAKAVKDSTVKIEKDLQDKIDQQKNDIFNHINSLHSASGLDSLRNRVDQLETATSQVSADYASEVTQVPSDLAALKETVDDLVTTMNKSGDRCTTLQQNSNEYVGSMMPMSADIAFLKDQHKDHEADCKARIQVYLDLAKDHTNRTKRDLQGRIQDHELAFRGHLSDAHNLRDNPEFLALHARVLQLETAGPRQLANQVHRVDRPQGKLTILTARVRRLATRVDELEGGMKSNSNHLKSCVAEDLGDLDKKLTALKMRVDKCVAGGCKHVGCNRDSQSLMRIDPLERVVAAVPR